MLAVEFEFIVEGPPLSVNTKKSQPAKHRKWQDKVKTTAKNRWKLDGHRPLDTIPTESPVILSISTYYTLLALDVDNVIKPIMDSLNGVLYGDDRQVYQVTSRRSDLQLDEFESPSSLLADALIKHSEFVHIEPHWMADEE